MRPWPNRQDGDDRRRRLREAIALTGTDADGDALTFTVVAQPAHGALTRHGPQLTYTPAANYNGPDSFTFVANDGTADSNIATVSLTVSPVNDAARGERPGGHDGYGRRRWRSR